MAEHTKTPWYKNKPGQECHPYLIADTSNGYATHRCGVTFGGVTGGQGWPAIHPQGPYTLEIAEANAEFIVRSCNSHEAMVNMVKELIGYIPEAKQGMCEYGGDYEGLDDCEKRAKALIALAEGKGE